MTIADYQRIVARIQRILSTDVDPPERELRDVAADLDAAIDEINTRLRECDDHLERGLRSEALALAEVDPSVFDVVRVLDFPELPTWIDYLSQFQLAAPPTLLIDVTAELGDAYNVGKSIEKWLRQHRMHALARSDLRIRSQILRQLTKHDAANPLWQNDLRVFETQRLKDLRSEADRAIVKRDVDALSQIESEINETPWLNHPGEKFVQKIRLAHDRLRKDDAFSKMQDLASELNDAFSALDSERGKQLFRRWCALETLAELSTEDELYDFCGPALDWINKLHQSEQSEQDFRRSLDDLKQGLDDGIERNELDRLVHQVERFGREIPHILLTRVAERRRLLDVVAARRSRMLIGLGGLSVAIFAGAIAFLLIWNAHTREVASNVHQIRTLVDGNRLTEARKYVDTLAVSSPKIYMSPVVRGLVATLEHAEREEDGRAEQFRNLISHALEIGMQNPSFENCTLAFEEIAKADSIAQLPAERTRVKEAQRDISREKNRLQKEVDDRFKSDLNDVVAAIEKLPEDSTAEHVSVLSRLGELQVRQHISDVYRAPVVGLLEKVKQEKSSLDRDLQIAKRLSLITDCLGQRSKYVAALQAYAKEHPGTTRAADFTRVAQDETGLWDSVERWNQLRKKWKDHDLRTISSADAQSLIEEYNNLNKDTPYPGEMGLSEKITLCIAVKSRGLPPDMAIVDSMDKMLRSAAIANLYMVEATDGSRYYSNELPQIKKDVVEVRNYVGLDLELKTITKLPLERVPGVADKVGPRDWLSPQSRFAEEAGKILKNPGLPWEEGFAALIDILSRDASMDAILKMQLMSRILAMGSKGSVFLAASLKTPIDILNQNQPPLTTNWIDSLDDDVRKQRANAKANMVSSTLLRKAFGEAIASRDAINKTKLGPSVQWVGWVYKSRRDGWACSIKDRPYPSSGDLLIIHADTAQNTMPVVTKVGEMKQGVVTLDLKVFSDQNASLRVEGRPVYVAIED